MTRWLVGGAIAAGIIVLGAMAGFGGRAPPPPRTALSLNEALGAGAGDFPKATAPAAIQFPRDHGAHPAYRSEWWYFTGNLATGSGRRFGFQLTFFRFALSPEAVARDSAWGTNQIYLAHFAVTDVAGGRMRSFERRSREALGLAGAEADPFRVWLDDWSASGRGDKIRLAASSGPVAIDLELRVERPYVRHGEEGLSRKSAEPGNATYYYSNTRMPVAGRVRIEGFEAAVRGLAWLDREWGSGALAEDQVGWDWFGLQLDDGRDLMFYQLRRADGGAHPFSAGTLVGADGSAIGLTSREVSLRVLDGWTSPRDGAVYPSRWAISVPGEALRLVVEPLVADQELNHTIRYWEGAVSVRGTSRGRPIGGTGYMELTGYGR